MDANAYRQFVELEERHFWFVGRRRIFFTLLDRELRGRRDLAVLDVGCGAGGMIEPLQRYGRVRGVDTSPEMVAVCHERGFGEVGLGDAYDLPVDEASQDLVTLFDTIEHIEDDERVLRECRAAMRPGGLLFISTPAYQFLYANNDLVANHERRYTARDLRGKLKRAGLEPVQVSYFNLFLFPAILPAVLLRKLRERGKPPSESTNLSVPIPGPLNRLLAAIMGSERRLLTHVSFPAGHSIVALARRAA